MADCLTTDTELTSIANAIRTKGGTSANLPYPTGFVTAIGNIPTGTARTSSDLEVSGATVTAPAGLYASAASKSVASGTAGTPTATKGTVSNHSVDVTPSVTNTTGYITGSTKTGTAVTVSASELVSGSETKTANGTYDVTNLAQLIVNVAGGGGSGLVYESGTYTPTADIAQPTISFTNAHTDRPILAMFVDATGTYSSTTNTNYSWWYEDNYKLTGQLIYVSSSQVQYARAAYAYRASNTSSISGSTATIIYESSYGDWISNSAIKPGSNSTSRYWRSGRTYKWIAVWGPTT